MHVARHQVDTINLTLVIYGLQMHKETSVENTTDLGFICVLLVLLFPAGNVLFCMHACHLLIMSVMHTLKHVL